VGYRHPTGGPVQKQEFTFVNGSTTKGEKEDQKPRQVQREGEQKRERKRSYGIKLSSRQIFGKKKGEPNIIKFMICTPILGRIRERLGNKAPWTRTDIGKGEVKEER